MRSMPTYLRSKRRLAISARSLLGHIGLLILLSSWGCANTSTVSTSKDAAADNHGGSSGGTSAGGTGGGAGAGGSTTAGGTTGSGGTAAAGGVGGTGGGSGSGGSLATGGSKASGGTAGAGGLGGSGGRAGSGGTTATGGVAGSGGSTALVGTGGDGGRGGAGGTGPSGGTTGSGGTGGTGASGGSGGKTGTGGTTGSGGAAGSGGTAGAGGAGGSVEPGCTGSASAEDPSVYTARLPSKSNRYLPFSVGAHWGWQENNNSSGASGKRQAWVASLEQMTGSKAGVTAFRVQATTLTGSQTNWQQDTGTAIVRHRVQSFDAAGALTTSHDLSPSKIHLDESAGHLTAGTSWTETYSDTKTSQSSGTVTTAAVTVTWTVEAVDEVVTVPAGTFSCLRVHRVESPSAVDSNGADNVYWYARGVGKVKETGTIDHELLGYCYP